jgi:hypothetical protein
MIKLFVLIIFSSISLNGYCQIKDVHNFKNEMHLRKSRVYKIIGYSCLATATGFFIKGSILSKAQRRANPGDCFACWDGLGEDIAGVSFLVLSIPALVIGANQKHKSKALSITINNNKTTQLMNNVVMHITQPTINFKITF